MPQDAPSTQQIEQGLAAGALAFGAVAALAPRVFTAIYGLGGDPRTKIITRLWGTRTAGLGAIWFLAGSGEQKRTLLTVSTAMNLADAVLGATASDMPTRSRVLGSASSAAFAAAGAYVLTQG